MFGKLKDKLNSALSIFSKKAEKEAEVKEEVVEKEILVEMPVLKEEIKEKKEVVKEKVIKVKEEEKIPLEQVKITYFVHGTTMDNENDIATGWEPGELSALGKKQSIQLKELIKDKKFAIVFCSDLKRAIDSAHLTFGKEIQIVPDSRLREANYGEFTLKEDSFKSDLIKYIEEPFPQGESYKKVEKRISEFLNYLYDEYKGKHIAIVAHQAPQLALEVLLNKKTWEQAINEDWRRKKAWQSGWIYIITKKIEIKPEEKKGFFGKIFSKKEEIKEVKEIKPEIKEEIIPEENKEEFKEEPEEKKSFFSKVKETFTTKTISADKFEELFWDLEIALLENNVSVEVIEKIKEDLKLELVDKPLPRDVLKKIQETLKQTLSEILNLEPIDLLQKIKQKSNKPFIIAFFGINGSGKTTSIAKLTHYLQQNNHSVVLAACDTFRAAAIQQLEEHADKLGVKIIKQNYGSDAAAVAFDAIKYAEKNKIDIVMIDTAGRLHSNANLMSELSKIIRVTKPDLNIFVGESITGNDCIEQARKFNELTELDGIILTKADVDEKGGAPLSIAYTIKKPILFLGIGQKYSDLEEFKADVIMERLGL